MKRKLQTREITLIKFENTGDSADGVLMRIAKMPGDNNKTYLQYTVKDDNGAIRRFNGSSHLDSQIFESDIGKYMFICFKGESRDGRGMKMFEVQVEEAPVRKEDEEESSSAVEAPPPPAPPAATSRKKKGDEDIPF